MALLQDWREYAYGVDINSKAGQAIWAKYFNEEKAVYEQLLANPGEVVSGTVKELAEKYNMELKYMVGFLDGINESLKTPNPIEDMDENTQVSLDIDLEQLYYHMVEAKADWLYELPAWDELLTPERRKELYMEQKKSGTIVKERRLAETILVHVAVVRSISSVVAENNNRYFLSCVLFCTKKAIHEWMAFELSVTVTASGHLLLTHRCSCKKLSGLLHPDHSRSLPERYLDTFC